MAAFKQGRTARSLSPSGYYIPLASSSTAPSSSANNRRTRRRRCAALLVALATLLILTLVLLRGQATDLGPTLVPPQAETEAWEDGLDQDSSMPTPKAAGDDTAPFDDDQRTSSPFEPRKPCNQLTESLVSVSPESPVQRFLSPSPSLATDTSLSARLDAWSSAPIAPADLWTLFNKQTCANPSVRRNANRLHARESAATWASVDVERVRELRTELVNHLRAEEARGALEEWAQEGKKGTRGIVWTAGNADTFDRVLTSLRLLRNAYGCSLPAHVFHFPSEAPSPEQVEEFTSLDAKVSPLASLSKDAEAGRTKSFHLKGAAAVQAPFDEVLLLDSDNIPVRDVTPLFESPEFAEMGAVLWPDFFKDQPENAIWSILGVQCRDEWTTEAGQVLVRKSQHLDALLLVEYMLRDWRFWFRFSDGDKDLFRYAFLALRKGWAVPAQHLASGSWSDSGALGNQNRDKFGGHSMLQYGMASETPQAYGRIMFVHANLLKRVLGNFNEGNTWGRTLRLRLPSVPSDAPSDDARMSFLTADDLANVSPLSGIGLGRGGNRDLTPSYPSSSRIWARTRALLERGLAMHFWGGHRSGGAYVLSVESDWADELAPEADWGEEDDPEGEAAEAERGAWREWIARERAAQCPGDGLRDELMGPDASGPEMKVIAWADDPDLREFEARYYQVGRGKASGTGFR